LLTIAGLRFDDPDYLYLLLAVPFVVYLWNAALRRRKRARKELFEPQVDRAKLRRTSHLSRPGLKRLKYTGLTLILIVLIIAVTRPRMATERVEEELVGIDMVILLDLSYSMRAEDIVPSRLEKAKEVIRNFIVRKNKEDRIALVAFAETSLILSYLTRDPENLLFYLDFVQPQYGTNIGRAVLAGLTVYDREDERAAKEGVKTDVSNRRRFMILLSDGEDHGRELNEALQDAAGDRVKVHTIGIGSRRSVPIPVALAAMGKREFLRGADGRQIYTQFREQTLRDVARRTGARFYRAFVGYEMDQAFQEILRREKQIAGFEITTQYEDLYPYLLLGCLGTFLVLLGMDRD
jgi:Ca-activated chloride channel family protein